MPRLSALVLYTAIALGANAGAPALAQVATPDLASYATGAMRKLVPSDPRPVSDVAFLDEAGVERRLADYRGKVLLVNFWATWCAPCRAEMPALDRLQAALGGEDFEVLTIATGRNPEPAVDRFYEEAGLTVLPKLRDARQTLARDMGVLGLPVTVLIDREGREVARLIGDAEWDSAEAKAAIVALTGI